MKTTHLNWQGPTPVDDCFPQALKQGPAATGCGVYAITGRHFGYDIEVLLYIGKTFGTFLGRLWNEPKNREWLQRMSCHLGASLYFASMDRDEGRIKAVETTLIHVHQPLYNSDEIVTPRLLADHLMIYNVGKVPPHLLPIVATDYPWFGKQLPFRVEQSSKVD